MAEIVWDRSQSSWVKLCTICKRTYVIRGSTLSWDEAFEEMRKFFSKGSGPDGFQYGCRECENHRRHGRKPNGKSREEILATQHGQCAICSQPVSFGYNAHIDHDHTTREIRGILCHVCNIRLPIIEDDKGWLDDAKRYLGTFKCE